MPQYLRILLLCLCYVIVHSRAQAQVDSLTSQLPAQYVDQLSAKAAKVEQQLDKKSMRILARFQKQERQLHRKIAKKDSVKAQQVFEGYESKYAALKTTLAGNKRYKEYIPSLDTLATSLKFLESNPQLIASLKDGNTKVKDALAKMNGLQSELQKAEEIKKFLRERREYLKGQLTNLGMAKELKNLNKEAYYYAAQIKAYKETFNDHSKMEKKAVELLSRTKLFKDFMSRNSQLASLFPSANVNNSSVVTISAGLQTRAQVGNLIQQQFSAGGPNAQAQFSQSMQDAQGQLNGLKDKLNKLGISSGSNNTEIPEGFKPNSQRTKRFLQRIELGANFQSQKANSYFPVTSDIGLSAGYKLSDNNVIGVGASYKMGWGQNIRNVRITHQGIGLRSFVDIKIKKSFWLSGGYEMNYRSGFTRFDQLRDKSSWQESGLIGLSKVISVKSKVLKKARIQLLWDFLSYQQRPKPSSILFRMGYNF
jgi:hypothetical protein